MCICIYLGIDTNIEVIAVSLTTWEAQHSPGITHDAWRMKQ